ncbi:MAG: cytochrome P450 [Alphaproteobacteria bacterium]|nr:cytochrome P450 [Alphaproteobacteria bacterium]
MPFDQIAGLAMPEYRRSRIVGMTADCAATDRSGCFEPLYPAIRRRKPGIIATIRGLYANPITLLTEEHYKNGIVIDRMFGLRAVSLNDPDHIRQVFVTDRQKYGIDPIRKLLLKRNFGRGMASVEGEEWRGIRKVAATQFTHPKLQRYGAEIAAVVRRCCLGQPQQQHISASRWVTRLAMDNGMKCLFSLDRDRQFEPMMDTNSAYLEHGMSLDVMDVMRAPAALPRAMKKSMGVIQRRHRSIVRALYHARIGRMNSGSGAPDDLLTGICRHYAPSAVSGGECPAALDNIGTMFGASYDTTSKVIAWAIYLLSQSPAASDAILKELDGGEHDHLPPDRWPDALPVTLATVREALRLYPAIPGMVRHALQNASIGSQPIKKGDYVVASIWLLHRSERHWNDGARFRIERFLPGGEASRKTDCYMPFGIGPRTCIGRQFAELECVITLAILLRDFDFRYAGKRPPEPVWKGTLRSSNGIPVVMTRRR